MPWTYCDEAKSVGTRPEGLTSPKTQKERGVVLVGGWKEVLGREEEEPWDSESRFPTVTGRWESGGQKRVPSSTHHFPVPFLSVLDTQYPARERVSAQAGEGARHHRPNQRHLRWAQHMATEVLAPPRGSRSHCHLSTSLASVWLCLKGAGVFRPREGQCQGAPVLARPWQGSQSCVCPEASLRDQHLGSFSAWVLEARGPGGHRPCPAGPACRK